MAELLGLAALGFIALYLVIASAFFMLQIGVCAVVAVFAFGEETKTFNELMKNAVVFSLLWPYYVLRS